MEEKKKLAKAKLEKEKIAGDEAKPMLFVPAPVKIKKVRNCEERSDELGMRQFRSK